MAEYFINKLEILLSVYFFGKAKTKIIQKWVILKAPSYLGVRFGFN